jgi:hypothetical protein
MSVLAGWVNRAELCEELSPDGGPLHESTIRHYEQALGLPSIKVGRRKFYNVESVQAWLRNLERKPG